MQKNQATIINPISVNYKLITIKKSADNCCVKTLFIYITLINLILKIILLLYVNIIHELAEGLPQIMNNGGHTPRTMGCNQTMAVASYSMCA